MAGFNVRKEMPGVELSRDEFRKRYSERFSDPVFAPLRAEINRILDAAWQAYSAYRKAPHTRRAGTDFSDPDYELSVDWIAASERIKDAERRQKDPAAPAPASPIRTMSYRSIGPPPAKRSGTATGCKSTRRRRRASS